MRSCTSRSGDDPRIRLRIMPAFQSAHSPKCLLLDAGVIHPPVIGRPRWWATPERILHRRRSHRFAMLLPRFAASESTLPRIITAP